jgi:RND family efflux transporter MFP subunit
MLNITNYLKGFAYQGLTLAKKHRLITTIVVFIVIIAVVALLKGVDRDQSVEESVELPTVTIESVRDLASAKTFSAVGTVEALSEARLQTESGGRVTGVYANIGDTVKAGTILISLENASERASLLQAEGSYEVAVASAQQSDSGVRSAEITFANAKDSAQSAARAAYTSVTDVVITSIDPFYSNPQSPTLPGVRVHGNTSYLSSERIALQTILPQWQIAVTEAKDLEALLNNSEATVLRTINLLDALIVITSEAETGDSLLGLSLADYSADLLAGRSQLNGELASLQAAESNLISAKENITRSTIGGTTSDVSLANAQIKIALGSLRAAQANFEKTVVRAPISGVINALYFKVGDYASPSTPAAIVANNNGLEISTAVNEEDAAHIAIGDIVTIEKTATGTISAIGGAIDPTTGKVAVKIAITDNGDVSNGSTISISFTAKAAISESEIRIPLSAIKITGSGPVVFTIDNEQELNAVPVTLGPVSGNDVVISSGVTLDSQIVVDARGLKAGQVVTISAQ